MPPIGSTPEAQLDQLLTIGESQMPLSDRAGFCFGGELTFWFDGHDAVYERANHGVAELVKEIVSGDPVAGARVQVDAEYSCINVYSTDRADLEWIARELKARVKQRWEVVTCEDCGEQITPDPAGSVGVWVHDEDELDDWAYELDEDHAARPPETYA